MTRTRWILGLVGALLVLGLFVLTPYFVRAELRNNAPGANHVQSVSSGNAAAVFSLLAATATPTKTRTPAKTATRTPTKAATRTPTKPPTATRTPTKAATPTLTPVPPPNCQVNNLPPPAPPPGGDPPAHSIGVRIKDGSGEFYDRATGEQFVPRGFNYIRLAQQVTCSSTTILHHSTFNVGAYDANRIETALAQMEAGGYNTVRVFLNTCCGKGVGDSTGGLSDEYLNSLTDFLRRAQAHRLAVILTSGPIPEVGGYMAWSNTGNTGLLTGRNRFYLSDQSVAAQARFWQDVIIGLRERNAPTDVILTYEVQNEAYFEGKKTPFTLTSGLLKAANGKTYDLSNPADKLRMVDEGEVYWATELRSAILALDPTALVSAGLFETSSSDGTTFPDRYFSPSVFIKNVSDGGAPLDFVDLHLYPIGHTISMSAEYFGLGVKREKPVILGEFSAPKNAFTTEAYGADGAQSWQTQTCPFNFAGWVYWTYDTSEQAAWWFAHSATQWIETALSPHVRPDPCVPWNRVGTNLALNKSASASANSVTASRAIDGVPGRVWNSQAAAPQWIEINLGAPQVVTQLRMVTEQTKSGAADHRVWRITPGQPPELLYEFQGTTNNGQVIDYTPPTPWENVQIIRIETLTNPGPVAWREIELLAR